jgi:hypothetical protein
MGPVIGDFAKALSWFLAAVTQGAANAWDRLTHRAPWEAEQIVKDDDSDEHVRRRDLLGGLIHEYHVAA